MSSDFYQDKKAIFQIFGALMRDPYLFDSNIKLRPDDFPEKFHRITFAAIHNLYFTGLHQIDVFDVDAYISNYPNKYEIFTANNGLEYLTKAKQIGKPDNYEHYASLIRKYTLLTKYQQIGIDISHAHPDNYIGFPACSIEELNLLLSQAVLDIQEQFLNINDAIDIKASDGMRDLLKQLKKSPEYGAPFPNEIFNTITRGARLTKTYLRSAPTGHGKTRLAIADVFFQSTDEIYDLDAQEWIKNGIAEPALFITTELKEEEIQKMAMAFISGVPEDRIVKKLCTPEEYQRVEYAIDVIERGKTYISYMPDFDLKDVERKILQYKRKHGIKYVYFDYLHTTLKIIAQIASISRGMKLREDQILLMFITKLKELCNRYNVFLFTSTQVNETWKTEKNADMNMLRGAKAIGDKIDFGVIVLQPTERDRDGIEKILANNFSVHPNLVYHIFKNRGNKFTRVKLWCHIDLGTLRTKELFLTDNDYNLIPIEATRIEQHFSDDTKTEEYGEDDGAIEC